MECVTYDDLGTGYLTQRSNTATAQPPPRIGSRMVEADLEIRIQVSVLGLPSYIYTGSRKYLPVWISVREEIDNSATD